jgi:glutathione S-transferase
MDRYLKNEPAPYSTSPYGDFDTMFKVLTDHLEQEGPWMLGERFSSADVLWGTSLNWTTKFELIPEHPAINAYVDRFLERPAVQRAYTADAELAAAQEAGVAV